MVSKARSGARRPVLGSLLVSALFAVGDAVFAQMVPAASPDADKESKEEAAPLLRGRNEEGKEEVTGRREEAAAPLLMGSAVLGGA